MIHYFCPDLALASSGMRFLYQHVDILNRHGHNAAILHQQAGFRLSDVPQVPVGALDVPHTLAQGDIVVVPEGCTDLLESLHALPVQLVVIALNWKYIFVRRNNQRTDDWRKFGVRHVLVNSPVIGEMLEWAMGLSWHLTTMGIDPQLYYYRPEEKLPLMSFIGRKGKDARELQDLLYCRNPAWANKIAWKRLEGLGEAEYAREIRRSTLYLNVSYAEGFPFSLLEAMRAGCIVAGYNSVGGQRELIGAGPQQNRILSENLDYPTLARRLEPLLDDMARGDLTRWAPIVQNGIALSNEYTLEREESTLLSAWNEISSSLGTHVR